MDNVLIDVDTSTIEHLDFVPALPCEHSWHERAHRRDDLAAWVQHSTCPGCKDHGTILICESGKAWMLGQEAFTHHSGCKQTFRREDWGLAYTPISEVQ